jgi:hypothetical protein
MNLKDRVSIPAPVMARDVGDETVILNLDSGVYFGLERVGARIWQLLGEGRTLAEVCDVIEKEYDGAREDIERDVLALVESLHAHNLIERA